MKKQIRKDLLSILFVLGVILISDIYLLHISGGQPHFSMGDFVVLLLINVFGLIGVLMSIVLLFVRYVSRLYWTRYWNNMTAAYRRAQNAGFTEESTSRQNQNEENHHHQQANASAQQSAQRAPSDEDMKILYHQLLKKYHPDFARGEDDKKFRTELTAKINKAYKEKDFATLKLFQ